MTGVAPRSVVVVGTGLIGTSIALALRDRGTEVWLADRDPEAARLAEGIGAGRVLPGPRPGDPDEPPGGPAGLAQPPGGLLGWLSRLAGQQSWLSWPCRPERPERPCAPPRPSAWPAGTPT